MNAPALIVRLELEAAPLVFIDALDGAEEARLRDWLDSNQGYGDLVARALELAAEARAA
jgi:hypothetical protein